MDDGHDTSWFHLSIDAWTLAAEAAIVAGIRVGRMSLGGPSAGDEARLMVGEKLDAALQVQAHLLGAAFSLTPVAATDWTLRHYRRKVRANRRRLMR